MNNIACHTLWTFSLQRTEIHKLKKDTYSNIEAQEVLKLDQNALSLPNMQSIKNQTNQTQEIKVRF